VTPRTPFAVRINRVAIGFKLNASSNTCTCGNSVRIRESIGGYLDPGWAQFPLVATRETGTIATLFAMVTWRYISGVLDRRSPICSSFATLTAPICWTDKVFRVRSGVILLYSERHSALGDGPSNPTEIRWHHIHRIGAFGSARAAYMPQWYRYITV